ncbi:MAG: hypothetical protein WCH76_08265 [Candidatus Riflemargulisbacteria bacterium]
MDLPSFVKIDAVSSRLETLMQQYAEKKSIISFSNSFNADTITECPRRLVYRAMGGSTSLDANKFLKDRAAFFCNNKWYEYLSECKSIRLIDTNLSVADCNYNIVSNVDVVLRIDENIYAVKIESVDSANYQNVQKTGAFKKHVVAVMVEMWLAEINNGLLIYENKDNNNFVVFHIEPYSPMIKSIAKKCEMMFDCKISGILPEKPYKEKKSNECTVCEFKDRCWL